MATTGAQKVSIHCLIQQNACRTLIGVHGQTVLPGDEEPCGGQTRQEWFSGGASQH